MLGTEFLEVFNETLEMAFLGGHILGKCLGQLPPCDYRKQPPLRPDSQFRPLKFHF